jgi:hypothetical protein
MGTSQSLSRVPDGGAARQTATYVAKSPTPDAPNQELLPGDYNGDRTVNAGDYVVWRNTVGSPSDHRADGSGPTEGVPDGAVDQLDYLFWKARYGDTLDMVGSGSGALDGTASAPVESTFGTARSAFDAAFIDLTPSPPHFSSAKAVQSELQVRSAATTTASGDLLMALEPRASTSREIAESLDSLAEPTREGFDVVDDAFALLDGTTLGARVERF